MNYSLDIKTLGTPRHHRSLEAKFKKAIKERRCLDRPGVELVHVMSLHARWRGEKICMHKCILRLLWGAFEVGTHFVEEAGERATRHWLGSQGQL